MPKKKTIVYHKDGSIWAKGKIVDGVCDGYWEWFRKDGTKMRSGYFKKGNPQAKRAEQSSYDGKQVGEWITYDKTGKIYKKTLIK